MTVKLFFSAIIKFLIGVALIGAMIFLPAWSINYWQAWVFMGILFIPMFIVGIILMIVNPSLLEKRLNAKEKEKDQKLVLLLSGLMFIAAFVMAGLSHRFNWLMVPPFVTFIGVGIFLGSYIMYGEVLRENTYLSRTIEVQEGQKVIDTGLYGFVRHPMYLATILLFISIGLVLGSLISFFILLLYIPIIVIRILNEEKVLEKDLPGYIEYKKKVKYRIFPFIW